MAYAEPQAEQQEKPGKPYGRFSTEDELVKWIHEQMKAAKTDSSKWRENAEEDYAFYAGEQWNEDDKSFLESPEGGRRVPIVFNRVCRTINGISGLEVQNRQEVRFVPRETSDSQLAEHYSAGVKWARDQCDAEDEDSEAFQDTLICGLGSTHTRLDYEEEADGKIIVDRFDPLESFWDCGARKKNLTDRKWNARVKKYQSKEEVKATWPDYEGTSQQAETYLEEPTKQDDASPPHYTGEEGESASKKPIEVICFNWYDVENVYRISDEAGELVTLSEFKFKKLKDLIESSGVRWVKQKKRAYYIAYLAGKELLDVVSAPVQDGFMINFITGLRDRNNNCWFGLVRLMIDPQKWANKWLLQILHIMNSNSKGGLLAEKDAFDNPKKAEKEWADPQAITWTKGGAISQGKIKEKAIVQFPAGFAQLMQYAVEAVNDTPGVNSEILGLAERDQPAILEVTRKQAGIVMLGIFFDSLRRYRKQQGRVLAALFRDFIADGRKLRIIGKEGKPEVIQLMKDQLSFTYDIVVDDAPNSPSMKDKTFQTLRELTPHLLKAGIPIPPDILDYAPLPTGLVEKWKELLQQSPVPSPEQLKMQEEMDRMAKEHAKTMEENQRLKADQSVEVAKLQQKSHAEQQDLQVKAVTKSEELKLEREATAEKLLLEREKAAAEIEIMRMKAGAEREIQIGKLQLDQEKAERDADFKRQEVAKDEEASSMPKYVESMGKVTEAFSKMLEDNAKFHKDLIASLKEKKKPGEIKIEGIKRNPEGEIVSASAKVSN